MICLRRSGMELGNGMIERYTSSDGYDGRGRYEFMIVRVRHWPIALGQA